MENLRVEYKRTLSREARKGLGSDVAAYANTKRGEIWFGVDDRGAAHTLNFLGEFPEAEDVELIVSIINAWPPDVNTHARPLQWLQGLKSRGHLFQAQQALFKSIQSAQDAQIVERIKECLESLRRS